MPAEQFVEQVVQTTPSVGVQLPSSSSKDDNMCPVPQPTTLSTTRTPPCDSSASHLSQTAGEHGSSTEISGPSSIRTDGRRKKGRARMTAAAVALVKQRLKRCTTTPPSGVSTAAEVSDEELSELLELHLYGESVHWPTGWSVAKATARLATVRRPG